MVESPVWMRHRRVRKVAVGKAAKQTRRQSNTSASNVKPFSDDREGWARGAEGCYETDLPASRKGLEGPGGSTMYATLSCFVGCEQKGCTALQER